MKWDRQRYIGMDFETSGLKPEYGLQHWRIPRKEAWATSFVWMYYDGGEKITKGGLFPKRSQIREMLEFARDEGKTIVCWNSVFDIAVCCAYGFHDLVMQCSWLDGMLVWRHQFIEPEYDATGRNKKSYSLKKAVPEFLPRFAGYEQDVDYHSTDPAELKKLHDYNIEDVDYTLQIAEMLFNKLTGKQQRCMNIEAQCLPMVGMANFLGMMVDVPYTYDLSGSLLDTSNKMLAKLAPLGVTETIVRSPAKLATLMFDTWGLKSIKKTKSGGRSTDREVLHELGLFDERAKDLRTYREALNLKTKFADTLIDAANYNDDWRARPQAIVFGTYSGRLTYSSKQGRNKDEKQTGFALHQMKNDVRFRDTIVAPPGYDIVEFDAAGQEFKWMACASMDPTMLKLCEPGEDAHSYMASRITDHTYEWFMANKENDSTAKAGRKLGKVSNLSLQYRTSWPKLMSVARVQYNIPMLDFQAKKIRSVYLGTYKGVPVYWDTQIKDTAAKGYVETLAGRRVVVKGDWGGAHAWSMASTAINYKIQGTGADQKYLALTMIKNVLVDYGAYFAWDLHDGLYFYVPHGMVERFIHEIKDLLDNLPYQSAWGYTPPVPMTFDCKVGKSWGSLKERHFA